VVKLVAPVQTVSKPFFKNLSYLTTCKFSCAALLSRDHSKKRYSLQTPARQAQSEVPLNGAIKGWSCGCIVGNFVTTCCLFQFCIIADQPGAVLAQKFKGDAPSAPSSLSPFSPFSEIKKYELHIGLHLKSVISRVASSVMGVVETRPEGPRAGVRFLGGEQRAPSPSVRGSGERCKLPQWGKNLHFGTFWDLKNHVRTVS